MPDVAAMTERDKQLDAALAAPALPADAPKNDLSTMGLVKRKPKAAPATAPAEAAAPSSVPTADAPTEKAANGTATNGSADGAASSEKRKADELDTEPERSSKKARVEEATA
jgi:hypothetical protein